MVICRQSRLQGTPQSFYGLCNLSEELFYHENYIYIEYGQLWLVLISIKKKLKSLLEEQSPCHSGIARFPRGSLTVQFGGHFSSGDYLRSGIICGALVVLLAIACVTSVSVGLGSKERPRNGILCP